MNDNESRIDLEIDVNTGTIKLRAPPEAFDSALSRTMELVAALDLTGRRRVAMAPAEIAPAAAAQSVSSAPAAASERTRSRARAGTGDSSNRPGRIGSFDVVKHLLTEPQEMELRAFFAEKAPIEQGDQIIVALYKGEQLLNRKDLSYNEIYTLMWLGGIKELPKALDVALARLADDQKVIREKNAFSTKFVGRQYVEESLPRKTEKAA
jgi:hypothetical protein